MEKIPFVYGKIVDKAAFINRKEELLRLQQNFSSLTNTILISPRRWGKSSLVKRAATLIEKKEKKYRICFIDLNNIRFESDFYKSFSEAVLNDTRSKLQDTLSLIKSIFKNIIPKISISPDPNSEISLSMDWQSIARNPSEVLNLPETIGRRKKWKIIICLDEFQNIGQFADSVAFQKKLRSHWQHHKHVSYCLYGSKRHMMIELFSDTNMPFYKFGDLIFLSKIKGQHWNRYLQHQFTRTGKKIELDLADKVVQLADHHSYYVQQLAQIVWFRTDKQCSDKIVEDSIEALQLQLSLLFQQITDKLSIKQINFLQALVNGEESLTSRAIIKKYNLGTSGTVIKTKKALEEKEILDLLENQITFNDPIYQLWLRNYYFG